MSSYNGIWDGLKGPEMDEINAMIGPNMGVSKRLPPKQPKPEDPDRLRGIVRMYNEVKGFGFLRAEDGEEYFVHESQFTENADIYRGARVSFGIEQNAHNGKVSAVNVRIKR